MTRVYLDTCCLNRPFDDQSQERIRLESEAVLRILDHIERGEWEMIGSDAIDVEAAANPDLERRRRVQVVADTATEHIHVNPDRTQRAGALEGMGLRGYDSLHVACAEAAGADILLTTDDAFVRRARRLQHELRVRVANPVQWLKEVTE
ncbi:MAG TPA: PIN domain-containing protein [Longimicrobium sp.]|nr:PIN domain-containing protein [Longimicrobium sp.]